MFASTSTAPWPSCTNASVIHIDLVDFPTPPFPEATTITWPILAPGARPVCADHGADPKDGSSMVLSPFQVEAGDGSADGVGSGS